jgi:hypothetical protein
MPLMSSHDDDTEELPPDSQFESFYDSDADVWSLRRIPSCPPFPCAEEAAA